MTSDSLYTYKTDVTNVVDGDTVDATIDMGFSIHHKTRLRVARINAPETRTKDLEEKERGLACKARVQELITGAVEILVKTTEKGKYGRWIAEVYIDGKNLSDLLVEEGHAKYVEY